MSEHDPGQLVADYLRRLTSAASDLPADRRDELIEEITAHIAEARAAGPAGPGGSPDVAGILERLGDPVQIAQAAAEPSAGEPPAGAQAAAGRAAGMQNAYEPYPGGWSPEPAHPAAVPGSVRNAVGLMYLGAAVSLTKVIVDLATEGSTRAAMLSALETGARKSGLHTTASQLNSGITAALAMASLLGLIGAGLWIFVARGSRNGKVWARATGSVLFGLDTLALLIGPPDVGIRGPVTAVTRILAAIVWLIGLSAVAFLWQHESGAFFRARRSR